MRRRLPSIGSTSAVIAAVVLVGCGELSPDELASQADAICEREQADFAEIQRDPPANAAESAEQTEALLHVAERETAELRELNAPDEVADEWDRYLVARERGIETMRRGLDAALADDRNGTLAALDRAVKRADKRRKLAMAAGLSVCGRSGGVLPRG